MQIERTYIGRKREIMGDNPTMPWLPGNQCLHVTVQPLQTGLIDLLYIRMLSEQVRVNRQVERTQKKGCLNFYLRLYVLKNVQA